MKEMRFQTLLNEIQKEYVADPEYTTWRSSNKKANMSGLLRLIYNYDELNSFGKRVVDTAKFQTPDYFEFLPTEGSPGYVKLCMMKRLTNEHESKEERFEIAQGWVEHCVGGEYSPNETEALMFIFWSLLVLCVDSNNKAKHLSTICDFAQMLQVTEQEVKDLLELVKIVFGQSKYIVLNEKGHLENSNDPKREEKEAAIHMSIKSPRILHKLHFLIKHFTGVGGKEVQYGRENIHQIKKLNTLGEKLKVKQ